MKITQKQLRKLVREEAQKLAERGGPFDFGFEPHGSERKIQAAPGPKWKKFEANTNMVGRALEKIRDAILDKDEEAAANWIQQAQKYAKLAYAELLEA